MPQMNILDIAEVIMGQSPPGEFCNTSGKGIPLLNGPTEFGFKYPTPVQYTTKPKKIAKPGDLLFCVRGSTVGRMNYADREYAIGRGLASFRSKFSREHTRLIEYLIRLSLGSILQSATGSTFPNVSKEQIYSWSWDLPPIEQQMRIVEILGSLDDKIEINRRMNETLEQMAMALYKHWFVDFGPFQDGEFVETELGMSIPNGWEICNFGDVSLNFNSRRIPLSNIQRQERKGSYPYYGAAGIIDFVDDYLYDGVFLLVGEDGSVMKDDGTPFLQYVEGKFWVNNHAHVIQGTNDVSTEWLMLHLKSTDISRYVTGAVQPKLSKGNLNSIPFVLPPTEIRKEFNNKIVSFFEQIRSNEKENKYLAETRDYLLPLLLSGEIELTEAQEQVEEVLANA